MGGFTGFSRGKPVIGDVIGASGGNLGCVGKIVVERRRHDRVLKNVGGGFLSQRRNDHGEGQRTVVSRNFEQIGVNGVVGHLVRRHTIVPEDRYGSIAGRGRDHGVGDSQPIGDHDENVFCRSGEQHRPGGGLHIDLEDSVRWTAEDELGPPGAPAVAAEIRRGGILLDRPHIDIIQRIEHSGAVIAPADTTAAVILGVRRLSRLEHNVFSDGAGLVRGKMIGAVGAGELAGRKTRITDQDVAVRVHGDAGECIMHPGARVLDTPSLNDCPRRLDLPPLNGLPVHGPGGRQKNVVRTPERTVAQQAIHQPGIVPIDQD